MIIEYSVIITVRTFVGIKRGVRIVIKPVVGLVPVTTFAAGRRFHFFPYNRLRCSQQLVVGWSFWALACVLSELARFDLKLWREYPTSSSKITHICWMSIADVSVRPKNSAGACIFSEISFDANVNRPMFKIVHVCAQFGLDING